MIYLVADYLKKNEIDVLQLYCQLTLFTLYYIGNIYYMEVAVIKLIERSNKLYINILYGDFIFQQIFIFKFK